MNPAEYLVPNVCLPAPVVTRLAPAAPRYSLLSVAVAGPVVSRFLGQNPAFTEDLYAPVLIKAIRHSTLDTTNRSGGSLSTVPNCFSSFAIRLTRLYITKPSAPVLPSALGGVLQTQVRALVADVLPSPPPLSGDAPLRQAAPSATGRVPFLPAVQTGPPACAAVFRGSSSSLLSVCCGCFQCRHACVDILDLNRLGRMIEDRLCRPHLDGRWRTGVNHRFQQSGRRRRGSFAAAERRTAKTRRGDRLFLLGPNLPPGGFIFPQFPPFGRPGWP